MFCLFLITSFQILYPFPCGPMLFCQSHDFNGTFNDVAQFKIWISDSKNIPSCANSSSWRTTWSRTRLTLRCTWSATWRRSTWRAWIRSSTSSSLSLHSKNTPDLTEWPTSSSGTGTRSWLSTLENWLLTDHSFFFGENFKTVQFEAEHCVNRQFTDNFLWTLSQTHLPQKIPLSQFQVQINYS